MTNQVVNSLPCWHWSRDFKYRPVDTLTCKYTHTRKTFEETRDKNTAVSSLNTTRNTHDAASSICLPAADFIIRFVELCLLSADTTAAAAAAVASNWSHVWWKNRPQFVESLHAWSGREPAGYRGHNPNTPTPLHPLTRNADGRISIVSQESLPQCSFTPYLIN